MNLTFRQLQVFAEVARSGSMLRAAEALQLTAPAVSMQVKELESQVGLPMFDRGHRKLALTTAGEYFLVYARRLLGTLREAEDAMARFSRMESGVLSVGMVSSAQYFVPRLAALFHAEHPAVELRLRLAPREGLAAMMQANEIDLAIMGRPPKDLPHRAEPFARHPHVLVTAPDHPFVQMEHVPAAALAREPFIVREAGSGARTALQSYLDEHRLQPAFVMELGSTEAVKQAVMAGLGVGLVSLHTIGLEWRHRLIGAPSVEGLPLMQRWHVVHTAGKPLSPAAEALRRFLLARGKSELEAMYDGDPIAA